MEEPNVVEATLLDFGESPKKPIEIENTSVKQNDKLLFDLESDFGSSVNVNTNDRINLIDVQPSQATDEYDLLGGFGNSDPFGAKPQQQDVLQSKPNNNFSDPFALFQSSTAQSELQKPVLEKTQSNFSTNFDPFGISTPQKTTDQSKKQVNKPASNDNFDPFSNLSWNAPSSGNLQNNQSQDSKTTKVHGSKFTASQPKQNRPNYSSAAFNSTSSGWKSS